jgi:cysteine desulfurase
VGIASPAIIDFDHAAATPLHPEVAAAIAEAQRLAHANPSSQHALGRTARRMLEDARERIVAALGMATASDTLGEVLFSRRDHPSLVNAALAAGRHGWRLRELALDSTRGTASAAVSAALSEPHLAAEPHQAGPRIVSLTLVCGQTGSIEDLPSPAHASRLLVHIDATQAAGLLAINFQSLAAATLALAPHKFGGPRGVGGLLIRGGVSIAPVQAGPQESGLRGGTEAVPLAAGFARAIELAVADREQAAQRVVSLRDGLESRVVAAARQAGIPAVVIAACARRCPHIATIAFPGLDRQALAMAADLAGVCLATGTACASGSSEPAPALVAMGLGADVVRGAVRLSVGRTTTASEIDQAVERLVPLLRRQA